MLTCVLNILKTIAVHLLREVVDELDQPLVAGSADNDVMKGNVSLGDLLRVMGVNRSLKGIARLFQIFKLLVGDTVAGKLGAERIQCPA